MKYSYWNEAIASFLFGEKKSDQQVLLFVTREDIARIGIENNSSLNKEQAFNDFIQAVKYNGDGVSVSPIEEALKLYDTWIGISQAGKNYPAYIAYLTLFVLPLTETTDRSYNANNYYDRVNDYFQKYGLLDAIKGNRIDTWNFRQLDPLWSNLKEWSVMIQNFQLGYFNITPFKNSKWVFVGKPLSQAIFPPKAINRLPVFFDDSGLMPGEDISDETFRRKLLKYGRSVLRVEDSFLDLLRNNTELGASIIDIVRNTYKNWSGYIEVIEEDSRKGYTVAQLKLCLNYDNALNESEIFYRVFSPNDYPEDLCFNDLYACKHIFKGWSNEIEIALQDDLILEDKDNKWKAKTLKKDIRILIPGTYYDFNEWIENSDLLPYSEMLLMVKESIADDVIKWINELKCNKFSELSPADKIAGLRLFKISPPYANLNSINDLHFRTEKKILPLGGVKTSTRTYLTGFLPDFFVENGDGTENLILTVEGTTNEINLHRSPSKKDAWCLPENLALDKTLLLGIKNNVNETEKLKIRISSYSKSITSIDEDLLPKRDKFGKIIISGDLPLKYAIGSKAIGVAAGGQQVYGHLFVPLNSKGSITSNISDDSLLKNDALLNMLTAKGHCSSKEYFEAFETVYNTCFTSAQVVTHPPLARLKRWSLNLLDYMGFLDYEYSSNKIVINAPQLIRIPAKEGGKVLLIGGRTPALIETIKKEAALLQIGFEIISQDFSLIPYLLPCSIVLSAFGEKTYEIERRFKLLAEKCELAFDPTSFPQYTLAEFSGNIDEYEMTLVQDPSFYSSGWSCKVFNPLTLRFDRIAEENIDTSNSLVEYRLNEYTYLHKLWKNGLSYSIDKNWGRFMILRKMNKNVIYIDYGTKLTAVPSNTPLPRLIEEAMTLFNGTAPKRRRMTLNGLETVYNIYENIPQIFAYNYFKKVGQHIIKTKIELL